MRVSSEAEVMHWGTAATVLILSHPQFSIMFQQRWLELPGNHMYASRYCYYSSVASIRWINTSQIVGYVVSTMHVWCRLRLCCLPVTRLHGTNVGGIFVNPFAEELKAAGYSWLQALVKHWASAWSAEIACWLCWFSTLKDAYAAALAIACSAAEPHVPVCISFVMLSTDLHQ